MPCLPATKWLGNGGTAKLFMPYFNSTSRMTSWQATKLHKPVVLVDACCFPGFSKTLVLYVEIIPDLTAMLVMMGMTRLRITYGGIVRLLGGSF